MNSRLLDCTSWLVMTGFQGGVAWYNFPSISAVIFLGLGGTNHNLSFWYQADKSEAQILLLLRNCTRPFALAWVGPIRISAFGTNLTNQKLSCWYHRTALTGSHTKPPIMPHFSEYHSVLINVLNIHPRVRVVAYLLKLWIWSSNNLLKSSL